MGYLPLSSIKQRQGLNYSFFVKEFSHRLIEIARNLINLEKIVNHNNPERQLNLGYAIASVRGKIIKRTEDVLIGEMIELKLKNGLIDSEIKNIIKNN